MGSGLLGILVFLFGLILVGVGYTQGPAKVSGGTQGTITVEQCREEAYGDDMKCSAGSTVRPTRLTFVPFPPRFRVLGSTAAHSSASRADAERLDLFALFGMQCLRALGGAASPHLDRVWGA